MKHFLFMVGVMVTAVMLWAAIAALLGVPSEMATRIGALIGGIAAPVGLLLAERCINP